MYKAKILLIDDVADYLDSALVTLAKDFSRVNGSGSMQQAEESFRKDNDFDVVIFSAAIDNNNGFDALAMIRSYCPDASIITYSDSPDVNCVIELLKNGVFDYLIAPFDIDKLTDSIRNGIRNRESFIEIVNITKMNVVESEKMSLIGEVAASVNHEINNPLCSISLNIEIIKKRFDGKKDSEEIQNKLDMIESDIARIKDITHKLAMIKQVVTTTEYMTDVKMLDIEKSTTRKE